MMEFLFCLLNHMKFYLTPYNINRWNVCNTYERRNKENFLLKSKFATDTNGKEVINST